MDQAEFKLQLKVWKDLAVSKQVLIRSATDALKLDPECSADELKIALDAAIKKSINAEATVNEAQEQAKLAVSVMEKKAAESEKAQAAAEAQVKETQQAKETYQEQMATEREAHIAEMKKIKAQLVEKEKTIKATNKALADTPENVVKKLKTLKKQKFDEAESRKRAENEAISLKKEKKQLDQRLEEMSDNSNNLVSKYKELFELCEDLHKQLSSAVDDASSLPSLPELDETLIEALETKKED